MHPSTRRLAASIPTIIRTPAIPPTAAVAAQLLRPIPLLRRILRVHRKALPIEMRVMGDSYLKDEFRRTRTTENPLQIVAFLSEWKKYLDFHEASLADAAEVDESVPCEASEVKRRREGQKLQPELFEKLSSEQLSQLYELLQATKEVWTDPASIAADAEAHEAENGGIPKGRVTPDLADKPEEK